MITVLNWAAVILVIASSLVLLLSRDWRWSIGCLAVQYLGVFWLVQSVWPLTMASTKLVTGWMACAALGITQVRTARQSGNEAAWPPGRLFHLLVAGVCLIATFILSGRTVQWLGIEFAVAWGSLVLIGMGLLQLGITTQPLRVIIATLTAMSGFEIIYATVETSTLVAALLVVVNLGLAVIGAYILNLTPAAEPE